MYEYTVNLAGWALLFYTHSINSSYQQSLSTTVIKCSVWVSLLSLSVHVSADVSLPTLPDKSDVKGACGPLPACLCCFVYDSLFNHLVPKLLPFVLLPHWHSVSQMLLLFLHFCCCCCCCWSYPELSWVGWVHMAWDHTAPKAFCVCT